MRIEYARPVSTGVTSAMAIGQDDSPMESVRVISQEMMKPWRLAVSAAAAYHGYRRTRSIGWTMGWMVAANLAPLLVGAVAVAQGFGKPAGR